MWLCGEDDVVTQVNRIHAFFSFFAHSFEQFNSAPELQPVKAIQFLLHSKEVTESIHVYIYIQPSHIVTYISSEFSTKIAIKANTE